MVSWGMESLPINHFSEATFLGSSPLACRAAVEMGCMGRAGC